MIGAAGSDATDLVPVVVERTRQLCAVPGPPLQEAARAAVVRDWWDHDGLAAVQLDATGNVWARVRDGTGAAIVVAAHLDTVFGFEVEHGARIDGDRLCGPAVGDDTVALAALSTLDALLPATRSPVWVLATVGEEGLGDLTGIKAALREHPVPIGALVALEGNYLGRVCTVGVGSRRWRVTVRGPGGHAWEAADAPSAVHVAAKAAVALTELHVPGRRIAVNVGRFEGGEAINARAQAAVFEVDLRTDDNEALEVLAADAGAVFSSMDPRCTVGVEPIGDRPAGQIATDHPLVRAAVAAQRAVGYEPRFTAASTDANAAHGLGVPAIAIGVTEGSGEHTEREWIALPPLARGLEALAATVADYDRSGR